MEWEKNELHALVSARKDRLSAKRQIIEDQIVISKAEILKKMREAEKFKERKKKWKSKHNKTLDLSQDMSDSEENLLELEGGIGDSIEIALL